jgi:hypothetical protein
LRDQYKSELDDAQSRCAHNRALGPMSCNHLPPQAERTCHAKCSHTFPTGC